MFCLRGLQIYKWKFAWIIKRENIFENSLVLFWFLCFRPEFSIWPIICPNLKQFEQVIVKYYLCGSHKWFLTIICPNVLKFGQIIINDHNSSQGRRWPHLLLSDVAARLLRQKIEVVEWQLSFLRWKDGHVVISLFFLFFFLQIRSWIRG